jgi:hypothetical protein
MDASLRLHHRPAYAAQRVRGLLLAFIAALALLGSGAAHAIAQCVPQASGVPALGGAPNFIDVAAGEPNYWPRLDDPRWRGALVRSFGSGASETATFKALRTSGGGAALYLSWYVKVDSKLDPFLDSLRVAFSTGGGSDEMIEVFPFTSVAASTNAAAPPSTKTRLLSGTWTVQPAEPIWLGANTRVWLDVPNQQWAINMRVPIAAAYDDGINLPAEFRIAFELQVSQADNSLVPYRLSDTVALNDLNAVPAAASWPAFNIALPAGDAGCIKSISVASNDVGTTNVDAGMVPRPNQINLNTTNTFFALPNNESGSQVAANQISGTFRIANWGSQPDWNDIPNPTTSLWKQINSVAVTNAGIIDNNNKASIAGGNALSFNWTLTAAERCEFVGGAGCPNPTPIRRSHQCMLVELSGGGLTYNPASVYRNMDFVDASTFEREADISVAGLAAGAEPKRDVYLYVQKLMMPKDIGTPQPAQALVDYAKVEEVLSHGGDGDGGGDSGEQVPGIAASATAPPKPRGDTPPPQTAPRPPLDGDFETLNQQYPTYVVHAFRDTGETITVNGQNRKLLRPQSSFGYYVHHEGALTGWDSELQGAQLIAPNYYKIAVPEGGAATVKTRIVAREQDTPPTPPWSKLPWWVWLVILAIIILILLLRRKSTP